MAPAVNATNDTELPYEHVPGLGYYKSYGAGGSKNWRNWTVAKEFCEHENAHLLVLNSDEEADAIKEVVKKFGTEGYYHFIGFDEGDGVMYMTIFSKFITSVTQQ